MYITHLIKNSAKEPKIKRAWLMTRPQIPKKSIQSPHIDLFWKTFPMLSCMPDSSPQKRLWSSGPSGKPPDTTAVNISHSDTIKSDLWTAWDIIQSASGSHFHPMTFPHLWAMVTTSRIGVRRVSGSATGRGLFHSPFWGPLVASVKFSSCSWESSYKITELPPFLQMYNEPHYSQDLV